LKGTTKKLKCSSLLEFLSKEMQFCLGMAGISQAPSDAKFGYSSKIVD